MNSVNENIKKYRIFRGLTQRDLALYLNKATNVVSNWENGVHSPDIESLRKICDVLEVTPNQIFGLEENPEYEKHLQLLAKYGDEIVRLEKEKKSIDERIDEIRRHINNAVK